MRTLSLFWLTISTAFLTGVSWSQVNTRVSVNDCQGELSLGAKSLLLGVNQAAMSGSGRFIAFVTSEGVDSWDQNGVDDVYVHDRATGQTTWISCKANGTGVSQASTSPTISRDGRVVCFESSGWFLSGTGSPRIKVWVRDRDADQDGQYDDQISMRLASSIHGMVNTEPDSDCDYSSISPCGQYVVFRSFATDLVSSDTNDADDVFVRTLGLPPHAPSTQTVRVSVTSSGAQHITSTEFFGRPRINDGGRFVLFPFFQMDETGDTDLWTDIFVHDRDFDVNGIFDESGLGKIQTTWVSDLPGDTGINGNYEWDTALVSDDGRILAVQGFSTLLSSRTTARWIDRDPDGDGNFYNDVDSNSLVTLSRDVSLGALSGDGWHLLYYSQNSEPTPPGITPGPGTIRATRGGGLERVTVTASGLPTDGYGQDLSVDGEIALFSSFDDAIIDPLLDTNGETDVFARGPEYRLEVSKKSVSSQEPVSFGMWAGAPGASGGLMIAPSGPFLFLGTLSCEGGMEVFGPLANPPPQPVTIAFQGVLLGSDGNLHYTNTVSVEFTP